MTHKLLAGCALVLGFAGCRLSASEVPIWEITCRRVLPPPPLANVGGGLLHELKLGDAVEWSALVPYSDIVDCAVLRGIAKKASKPVGVFLAFPLVHGGLRVCAFEIQADKPSGSWEEARLCVDLGAILVKTCSYSSIQGNFDEGEVSFVVGANGRRSDCEVIVRSPFRP